MIHQEFRLPPFCLFQLILSLLGHLSNLFSLITHKFLRQHKLLQQQEEMNFLKINLRHALTFLLDILTFSRLSIIILKATQLVIK